MSYKLAQNNQTDIMTDINNRTTYKLGTLSGNAESENGKKLFNNCEADKTGGCSYGAYQIATGTGTMKDYLNYIKKMKNIKNSTICFNKPVDLMLQSKELTHLNLRGKIFHKIQNF